MRGALPGRIAFPSQFEQNPKRGSGVVSVRRVRGRMKVVLHHRAYGGNTTSGCPPVLPIVLKLPTRRKKMRKNKIAVSGFGADVGDERILLANRGAER